ncbi:hypothetical protein P9164_21200, partial [Klebsiella pneumoniae]|nr:hypothetical protein [Klebsiella pneumoniae]
EGLPLWWTTPTDGGRGRLRRLRYSPPGRMKAGVLCCSRERGGGGVAFKNIPFPPPLDKALHDLS